MSTRRAQCGGSAARILLAVLALVLLLVVVGMWRSWFTVSVADDEGKNRVDVTLSVDQDRIREDAGEVVDESKRMVQSADVLSDLHSIEGTVVRFDEALDELTLNTDKEEQLTLDVDETVEIQDSRGVDDASVSPATVLQAGTRVAITYHKSDAGRRAMKITVLDDANER